MTGMERIQLALYRIQLDRRMARTACSAAGRGAATPGAAVRRTAAPTARRTAATTSAFVLLSPQFNEGTSLTAGKAVLAAEPSKARQSASAERVAAERRARAGLRRLQGQEKRYHGENDKRDGND